VNQHVRRGGRVSGVLQVADGEVPDPLGLAEAVAELGQRAERVAPGDEDVFDAMLAEVRTTPLDPSRPALDLLEDLLVGIEGCAELFAEYGDYSHDDADDEHDEVTDDERADARGARIRAEFIAAVREVAAAGADRLL
jgi:hypothetical protein